MAAVLRPVRWGVLSTALINDKVLAGAAQSPEVEVLAVASRDTGRARAYADARGIDRAYGSYPELLADPDVEAVYVPLPNALHHRWTLAALRAGKHVLCEKPYSRRPTEVEEGFAVAREHGLVLSEAFMWRYHPQTRTVADLVRDGAIGDLRLVVAAFSWPCPPDGDIRTRPDLDGGSLMDVGCYCVSAARLLAGEPVSVTAQATVGPHGVDAHLVATMAFAGGALAHLDCGFHVPDRSRLELVGTAGTIEFADPWHCAAPAITVTGTDGTTRRLDVEPVNSYRLELEEMGRAIRGEPSTLLGEADALGQARTLEALYRAADSGGSVTL